MIGSEKIFIDTNILLFAAIKKSNYHDQANSVLLENENLFCSRQVLMEFSNNYTNGKYIKGINAESAIRKINDYLEMIELINDSDWEIELFNHSVQKHHLMGRSIFDLRIYLSMKTHGIKKIFTHNIKDFEIFKDIEVVNPFEGVI